MSDKFDSLRNSCESIHQRLHKHPLLSELIGKNITRQNYYAALTAFYASYKNLICLELTSDWPNAPGLEWLEQDIDKHGIEIDSPQLSELNFDTYSKTVGFLYVKQGSTLGGQLISKNLFTQLNITPQEENRFFHGYGKETSMRWKQYHQAFENNLDRIDLEEACGAALTFFERIEKACDLVYDKTCLNRAQN